MLISSATHRSNQDIFRSIGDILDRGFTNYTKLGQGCASRPPGVRKAAHLCWVGECSTGEYEESQEPPSLQLAISRQMQGDISENVARNPASELSRHLNKTSERHS